MFDESGVVFLLGVLIDNWFVLNLIGEYNIGFGCWNEVDVV